MPHAICTKCNEVIYFRNKRGYGMPQHCFSCGGPMTLARPTGEFNASGGQQYEALPREPGRRRVNCALCGAARMFPGPAVEQLATPTAYYLYQATEDDPSSTIVPAGEFVCWYHKAYQNHSVTPAANPQSESSHG